MHVTSSPTSVMPDMSDIADDEDTLWDIARIFSESRRWIMASTLVCLMAGAGYTLLAPAQYEASATIEMAAVSGTPVETPQVLAEKLKFPLHYSANTHHACGADHELPTPGEFLATQFKPAASKNAPIVSIRFRQTTPQGASRCLEAVLADIKRNQGALFKPVIALKLNQLQILQNKLNDAEKLIAHLPVTTLSFVYDDPEFGTSALLLAMRITKENEVRELRNQIYEMQVNLSKPLTQETSLAAPIFASDSKVAPRSTVIIPGSLITGIILGMLLWALRRAYVSQAGFPVRVIRMPN